MYLNQLTIIGFTGQDAEFHFMSNGTPVTTVSVATKESWKNADGDWQSQPIGIGLSPWEARRIRQDSRQWDSCPGSWRPPIARV